MDRDVLPSPCIVLPPRFVFVCSVTLNRSHKLRTCSRLGWILSATRLFPTFEATLANRISSKNFHAALSPSTSSSPFVPVIGSRRVRYPRLLEMELDVLHSLIESPSVVTHFPALAKRIANKELPHGADVIVGIHTRFLKRPRLESTPAETQHKKLKRCNDGEGAA